MGGREVPFGERGVLDDIKGKQLGYGEKPDYIGVAATLNFVRSEKLWYEACASEGCQKKVVQNTDGTWMRARGVLSCFHFLGWTRGHQTTPGVVSFLTEMLRAGARSAIRRAPSASGVTSCPAPSSTTAARPGSRPSTNLR